MRRAGARCRSTMPHSDSLKMRSSPRPVIEIRRFLLIMCGRLRWDAHVRHDNSGYARSHRPRAARVLELICHRTHRSSVRAPHNRRDAGNEPRRNAYRPLELKTTCGSAALADGAGTIDQSQLVEPLDVSTTASYLRRAQPNIPSVGPDKGRAMLRELRGEGRDIDMACNRGLVDSMLT